MGDDIDLHKLPIVIYSPKDGGPYFEGIAPQIRRPSREEAKRAFQDYSSIRSGSWNYSPTHCQA